MALTDRKGEVVMRYAYEAFGQPWAGIYGPYNRYGFTGKPYDEKTGLYYYGARWYDPQVGRWMSQDPIRDGVNWYAYVNNNPVNFVDPWGLEPETPGDGTAPEPLQTAYEGLAAAEVVSLGVCTMAVGAVAIATATVSGVIVGAAAVGLGVGIVAVGLDLFEGGGADKTTEFIDSSFGD